MMQVSPHNQKIGKAMCDSSKSTLLCLCCVLYETLKQEVEEMEKNMFVSSHTAIFTQ